MKAGQIVGNWELLDLAGVGASAEVWRARRVDGDELAAVKLLIGVSPARAERLAREGRTLARLRHPNLLRMIETAQFEDRPALVLEWVDGSTLEQWATDHPLADLDTVEELFRGIAEGVAHVHGHGVVHRDLKPANVLLSQVGELLVPKVGDFGIAWRDDDEGFTAPGALLGTPRYMAPEHLRDSSKVDARSDVFSLGCILYELVTGRPPFPDEDLLTRHNRAIVGGYQPPVELRPDLPERFSRAILGALAGDPGRRIATVLELVLVLGGAPLAAANSSPTWDEGRPAPRRRIDATLLGREREIGAIEEGLREVGAVAVVGPSGCGRSRIAAALVARRGGRVVELGGRRGTAAFLCALAESLGAALPENEETALDELSLAIAKSGGLVVLDDADDAGPWAERALSRWLDLGVEVVWTARRVVAGFPGRTVVVPPLAEADARRLLLSLVGPLATFDSNDPALTEVLEALEGHPRQIELAAARLGVWTPAQLLERLQTDRKSALATAQGPATGADDWWLDLSEEERAVLAAVAVFPESFTPADASAVAGLSEERTVDILAVLRNRFLVTTGARGLGLRRSVRAHVDGARPPEVDARWIEHVIGSAVAAGARWAADPRSERFRPIADLLPQALAVHRRVRGTRPDQAARIGAALGRAVQLHDRMPLAAELVHGDWAKSPLIPVDVQGDLTLVAVPGLVGWGRPLEACARIEALDMSKLRPRVAIELSSTLARLQARPGALATMDRLIEAAEPLRDSRLNAQLYYERGGLLYDLARDTEALSDFERTEAMLPSTAVSERVALENKWGIVCSRIGDVLGAERRFRRARQIASDAGMRGLTVKAGKNLAICVALQRRFPEATALFDEFQAESLALGDEVGMRNLLGNQLEILLSAGRVADAERTLAERGGAAEHTGDAEYLAWFECLRGEIDLWHGRLSLAEARFRRAAAVAKEGGEHHYRIGGLCLLAAALADQDRLDEAKQVLAAVAAGERPSLHDHLAFSRLHIDLGRVRRGDPGAAQRVSSTFAKLRSGISVECDFRVALFAKRLAALSLS